MSQGLKRDACSIFTLGVSEDLVQTLLMMRIAVFVLLYLLEHIPYFVKKQWTALCHCTIYVGESHRSRDISNACAVWLSFVCRTLKP